MPNKCKKLFLFELARPFSSISKINQKISMKILCNIAIKLAAGEVTKLGAILMKNSNFELSIYKNMLQNVRIRVSCQN